MSLASSRYSIRQLLSARLIVLKKSMLLGSVTCLKFALMYSNSASVWFGERDFIKWYGNTPYSKWTASSSFSRTHWLYPGQNSGHGSLPVCSPPPHLRSSPTLPACIWPFKRATRLSTIARTSSSVSIRRCQSLCMVRSLAPSACWVWAYARSTCSSCDVFVAHYRVDVHSHEPSIASVHRTNESVVLVEPATSDKSMPSGIAVKTGEGVTLTHG